MFRNLVFSACAFAVVLGYPTKRQDYVSGEFGNGNFKNDFFGAESNTFESFQGNAVPDGAHAGSGIILTQVKAAGGGLAKGGRVGGGGVQIGGGHIVGGGIGGGGDGKLGFSSGSGLRSIAQGSAEQANTAVLNQDAAGHQAAFVAKNTLAQAANAASATAQAALAGKQVILQGLEQQYRDGQVALQGEKQQLQQAQRAAVAAQQTSNQAQRHVQVLTAALNVAQATADGAGQAASEAAGELAAQVAMVGAAQQRLDLLAEQLHGVRIDFDATQAAALKAQQAALQAQANAAQAAAAAAAASGVNNPSQHEQSPGGVLPVPDQGQGQGQGQGGQDGHGETYISADYYE